jgi:predicted nucleotidyltransferase
MKRAEAIARLKTVEPALRARGVGALYLFGSYSRDEAGPDSDLDVFVDPADDEFYGLDNFIGTYEELRSIFPGNKIGYSTREGLSKYIRADVEEQAIRIF